MGDEDEDEAATVADEDKATNHRPTVPRLCSCCSPCVVTVHRKSLVVHRDDDDEDEVEESAHVARTIRNERR